MHSTTFGRRVLRARLLLCVSTVLASGLAVPAIAQTVPTSPVRQTVDENGVDLFSGALTVTTPAITIGGDQGLSYYRFNRGNGWADDMLARISQSGSVVTVSLGNFSDQFAAPAANATVNSTEGNGATLFWNGSGNYTYTRSDGTVVHFAKTYGSVRSIYGNIGKATDLVRPDGSKLTYTYGSLTYCSSSKPGSQGTICLAHATEYRMATVTSSFGYKLSFGYAPIADYDPNDPDNGPDFDTWFTITGVTASNAAAAAGSPTLTMSFANGGSTITDPLGQQTQINIGTSTTTVTRPGYASPTMTVTFASGKVSSVTTPSTSTTYAYSDAGNVRTVTVTDAQVHATVYKFDIALQRMTSRLDKLNQTTTWEYDTSGRLTRTIQPEGNYTRLTYDSRGNITERRSVSKTPGTPPDIVETASYPATCSNALTCNQPTSTTDARGNVTDYTYDATHGGVLTVTAPAPTAGAVRPQTRYGYTALQAYFDNGTGSITASGQTTYQLTSVSQCQTTASCAGAADEVRTTISYGPQTAGQGNNLLPVSTTTQSGDGSVVATTSYGYDAIGNVTNVDGPLPGSDDTTYYRYDVARQRVGGIAPDPDGAGGRKRAAQRLTYRPDGKIQLVEAGTVNGTSDTDWAGFVSVQQASASYDANGRRVSTAITAGGTTYGVTQYSYDTLGRIDCTTQRMNSAAWGALPGSACTAQTAGAAGPDRVTQLSYDAESRVASVTTALGTAEATTESLAYTANGQQLSVTDGNGNLTTYRYDGHDRIDRIFYPSPSTPGVSSTTDWVGWGYGATGRLDQYRLRDGQVLIFDYDALDRTTRKRSWQSGVGVTETTDYEFDLLGRTTSVTKGSLTDGFSYDALGRMTNQSQPWASIASQYDAAGRRTRVTWSDGFYVAYDYDNVGSMLSVRENGATSGVGVLATYGYDDLGRRTSLARGNGTVTSYGYDPVSRLASLGQDVAGTGQDVTASFGYHPSGQIASVTRSNDAYAWTGAVNVDRPYSVNGLNQLTQSGTTALGYDARGNLTSSGATNYAYSAENQLTSASGGLSFFYDGIGRLAFQNTPQAATAFLYDGGQMTTEYDKLTLAMQRRYVWGADVDEPLVWYEGAGTSDRRFLHADERGSVIAVSNASGTVTNINSYDEYGIPAATNVGRFQYTGQAWLPELGMYYYKARIYSPTLGRFLQTDPIGYGDGLNWYNYVGSDPVNATDPSGLRCLDGTNSNSWDVCKDHGGFDTSVTVTTTRDSGGGSGNYNFNVAASQPFTLSGPSLRPGAFDPVDVTVTASRNETKKPTRCQIRFLKGFLKSKGLPTNQLDRFIFVNGLDSRANLATRIAFRSAPAVTQGTIVYVQPNRFQDISRFRTYQGFEEAYHSGQFALLGAGTFYDSYATMSVAGAIIGEGPRGGNLSEQFAEAAAMKAFDDYRKFGCN